MKAFFVTLALALFCSAASVATGNGQEAATQACGSTAEVLTTSTVSVGGKTVNLTTFSCPSPSKRALKSTLDLGRRASSECTNAAECQCGQELGCACDDDTLVAPNPNDCFTLIDATTVLAEETGETFFLSPNTFNSITFDTCGIFFTNLLDSTIEYCWNELASFASGVTQDCLQGSIGTSATCTAESDAFTFELFNVNP